VGEMRLEGPQPMDRQQVALSPCCCLMGSTGQTCFLRVGACNGGDPSTMCSCFFFLGYRAIRALVYIDQLRNR
jgi:hypothetical protein